MRAAYDIGSGATKVAVARVRYSPLGVAEAVEDVLYSEQRELQLRAQVMQDDNHMLSQDMLQKCLSILREFSVKALDLGAKTSESVAICTSVFRTASNSKAFVDGLETALGFRPQIISQLDEAKLGYLTACAVSKTRSNIISWDSGGGSFQVCNSAGELYGAEIGSAGATNLLLEIQGRSGIGQSIFNRTNLNYLQILGLSLIQYQAPLLIVLVSQSQPSELQLSQIAIPSFLPLATCRTDTLCRTAAQEYLAHGCIHRLWASTLRHRDSNHSPMLCGLVSSLCDWSRMYQKMGLQQDLQNLLCSR